MSPALAFIIQEAIKSAPLLAIDLAQIFSKDTATDADWDALRAKWSKTHEQRAIEAATRAQAATGS